MIMCVDITKPIEIPDEWVTWEGKDEGKPRPEIIWYGCSMLCAWKGGGPCLASDCPRRASK